MRQHDQSKSRRLTRRAASTVLAGTALALAAGIGAPAVAAEWPTKAITIVVAYPAGGGTDISIRALTDTLGETLERLIDDGSWRRIRVQCLSSRKAVRH